MFRINKYLAGVRYSIFFTKKCLSEISTCHTERSRGVIKNQSLITLRLRSEPALSEAEGVTKICLFG